MPLDIGLGAIIAITKGGIKIVSDLKGWFDRRQKGLLDEEDLQFLGDEVGVVMGEGNIHKPTAGASPYIRSAASSFLNASGRLRKGIKYVDQADLAKNPNLGALLLGGPVANAAYRSYCGYLLTPSQGQLPDIPTWIPNHLRWGFFLGIGQWGSTPTSRRIGTTSELEPLTVKRWSPEGKLVEGPRYGIVDSDGIITMLPVTDSNELAQDFALITRLERRDAPGRYLTMVAGAHGYSTAAFGSDWRRHTKFLKNAADKVGPEFQVLIPVALGREAGAYKPQPLLDEAMIAPVRT